MAASRILLLTHFYWPIYVIFSTRSSSERIIYVQFTVSLHEVNFQIIKNH